METLLFQMIENSSDAYVIFKAETQEIIYKNQLAEECFVLTEERANKDFFHRIEAQSERREIAFFPNTPMKSVSGTVIYCNIEGGYLDEEKTQVWGKITPISSDLNTKKLIKISDSDVLYLEAVHRLYQDVLFRVNPETRVLTHVGDMFLQFGVPREMENFPHGLVESQAIHPDDVEDFLAYSLGHLSGEAGSIAVRIRLIDESYEWFSIETTAVRGLSGELLEVIGKISNIEDNKRLEAEVSYDVVSHTLNQHAFENVVKTTLEKRMNQKQGALFYVDIDDFQYLNETYGHEFCGYILGEVGERLTRCVRNTDFVGRVGDDEFMIFMKNVEDVPTMVRKAKQMLTVMAKPISRGKDTAMVSVSLGMAEYPSHGSSLEALGLSAEKALGFAKENGKSVAALYSESMREEHLVSVLEEAQRYHHALEMLDRSTSAFVVFHKETKEVMSENQKARDLFYNDHGEFDVNEVFGSAEVVVSIIAEVESKLAEVELLTIPEVEVKLNTGKKLVSDLEFSYISGDRIYVYLKFTPKNDKKVSLLKTLIEKYTDPVVVVNKDEDLSISYGNSLFYSDCGCTEDNFEGRYGSTLKDLFLPEKQELFMGIIWRTMRGKKSGYIKTPLQLANGEERWLYYDMDKLRVMDSELKIYCQLMKEMEESVEELVKENQSE